MKPIMVTVEMLCYNHGPYIRKAIEGVINQKTDFRYQVIIHDDASTDNSAEIIREYQSRYPELITAILQKENQFGKKVKIHPTFIDPLIEGKYIAACECDDYWTDENKLQKQVDILEAHPEYVGCTHNCVIVDKNDTEKGYHHACYYKCRQHVYRLNQLAFGAYFPGQTAALMYRKECMTFATEEQRQSYYYGMRTRTGDQRKALHLLLQGDIFYLGEVMSAHRVVADGGDSWTARTRGKNLSYERFASSIDYRNYAKKYYGKKYLNYYSTFRAGVGAIWYYLKKRTEENKTVLSKVAEEKGGIFGLVCYLIGLGIISVPLCIARSVQKRKALEK